MPKPKDEAKQKSLLSLSVRAESVSEEDLSFECVATTQTPVPIYDYRYGVIEEILVSTGVKADLPIPVCKDHASYNSDAVLGKIDSLRMENNQVIAKVSFVPGDEIAEKVFKKIRHGALSSVSAGYQVLSHVLIRKGDSYTHEGTVYTAKNGDVKLSINWALRELSVVPVSADPNSRIRSGDGLLDSKFNSKMEDRNMNELMLFLRSLGLSATADETRARAFVNLLDAENQKLAERFESGEIQFVAWQEAKRSASIPKITPPSTLEPGALENAADLAVRRALDDKKKGIENIRALGKEYGIEEEVINRAVNEGLDMKDAGKLFMDNMHKRRQDNAVPQAFGIVITNPGEGLDERGFLADTLFYRAVGSMPKGADERRQELVHKNRGLTLLDAARHCLVAAGQSVSGYEPTEIFERAISTHQFTTLLDNIANKSLGSTFVELASTAQAWMGRKQSKDFKVNTQIRLSNLEQFQEIGDGGEFPHGKLTDEAETYKLKTFGQLLSFTRKQMINDDLGALTSQFQKLGSAAKRTMDDRAYLKVLNNANMGDGTALFATGRTNPNYFTGAGSILAAGSLATAKKLLRKQVGMVGESLSLQPKYLIVPPSLEHTALTLLNSSFLVGSTTANTLMPSSNVHAGSGLELIVEPRLENGVVDAGALVAGSAASWYLACDYGMEEHFALMFLNGNETPVLEQVAIPGVLGMGWRMYFDVEGVAAGWRGIVKSLGDA